MPTNKTVTVIEADGVTTETLTILDVGRQDAAASKSIVLSTEDKNVLDSVNSAAANLTSSAGPIAPATAAATTAFQISATYNSTLPTFTNTQQGGLQLDSRGRLIVELGSATAAIDITDDYTRQIGKVKIVNDAGTVINPVGYLEDDSHTTGDGLVPAGVVYRSSKTQGAGSTGDYTLMQANAVGDLHVDGGQAFIVRKEPTVTAGAYTANDIIGGEQEITAAARASGAGGVLTGITMIAQDDSANLWVANDVKVLIFDSNPGGTYTDNVALDSSSLTDADAQDKLLGAFTLDTAVTLGNIVMLKAENINMPYVCSGSDDLFAVAINVGGRTPDAVDGITFVYHMIRD